MPIDFSSDPELTEKLRWMERFVRGEIWPLEALGIEFGGRGFGQDGPDEVHRRSIAKMLLREREASPTVVPSEHIPTRRAAALERYGLTARGTDPKTPALGADAVR